MNHTIIAHAGEEHATPIGAALHENALLGIIMLSALALVILFIGLVIISRRMTKNSVTHDDEADE